MTKKTVKRKQPMMIDVADYRTRTWHLSPEEHGAYLLLLMFLHRNDKLPTEDIRLSRVVNMPLIDWLKIQATVMQLVHAHIAEAR